jgi:hypothetical protein
MREPLFPSRPPTVTAGRGTTRRKRVAARIPATSEIDLPDPIAAIAGDTGIAVPPDVVSAADRG